MLSPREVVIEKSVPLEGGEFENMCVLREYRLEGGNEVHISLMHIIDPNDDRAYYGSHFVFPEDYYRKKIAELRKNGACVMWSYASETKTSEIVSTEVWRLILVLFWGKVVRFLVSYDRSDGEYTFSPGWEIDQITLPNELPLLIQYTELLKRHRDPDIPELRQFVENHKDDIQFVRRAETLNKLWTEFKM